MVNFWNEYLNLKLRLAGAYDPNEDYSGKYMTAFYFEGGHGIEHCHCTHKYLGELDLRVIPEVIEMIDDYFKKDRKENRTWVFNKFSLFGEEKDTPVLERTKTDDMFLDLKNDLDSFRDEDYPTYKPHITLGEKIEDLESVEPLVMKPISLGLVSGNSAIKTWDMV